MNPAFPSASSLLHVGLLSETEFEKFKKGRRFPAEFAKRVLDRFGPAIPVAQSEMVAPENIFWVDAFSGPSPPTRTYDGPLPPDFVPRHIPRQPVILHDAHRAKMFLGFRASTLLFDAGHYYEGISSLNSEWITPALAGAEPDIVVDGTAAVLFANGGSLYSHWMFDVLPKFEILNRAGWTDDKIDFYIVNSCSAPFCTESFARIGIDRKKIIDGTGQLVSARRLLVPSQIRHKFWTPDWVRAFVVSKFVNGAHGSKGIVPEKRIYISRAKARRRRVANEQEVRNLLQSRGFLPVLAEDMAISEVAALMRGADTIVAPHGAGVANVVFARAGVRVLELFGAHIAPEGWLLASAVGGKHFVMAGKDDAGRYQWESEACQNLSLRERNEADYIVDPIQLSKALEIVEG